MQLAWCCAPNARAGPVRVCVWVTYSLVIALQLCVDVDTIQVNSVSWPIYIGLVLFRMVDPALNSWFYVHVAGAGL